MTQITQTLLKIGGGSLSALLVFGGAESASAITFTDWEVNGGIATGDLDGISITTSGFNSSFVNSFDLSGSDFSAAPGSSSEEGLVYSVNSDWTVTFDSPVDNLLLYPVFWRGSFAGGPNPVTYTFNQSFTILSGLTNASVNGNTLELPTTGINSGIIQFDDPVTSLTLQTSATGTVQPALTFAVEETQPIPFEAEGTMGLVALGGFFWYRKRKQANNK